jgi:hypothetical protein
MKPLSTPRPSAAEVRARLAAESALPSRLGHTALLLAGLAGAAVTASLALTEPDLPAGTRIAFVVLMAIGLTWSAFAAWVLARRRTLLAWHRVVAGSIAVAFSVVFTVAALALALWLAAAVGAVMTGTAGALLVRARRRVAVMRERLRALQRRLEAAEATS